MKKRILSISGTRADYGIYTPVYRAIMRSDFLSLEVVAVGMHLLPAFGNTIDQIRRDDFPIIAEIDTLKADDTRSSMARYVGESVVAFTDVLERQRPDMILLLGDRGEMLAAATAATYLRIPIAHLQGGEQSGGVDDPVRHAITQLAHVHLTTAQPHADAVARMRSGMDNVHVVGSPALDVIAAFTPVPKAELFPQAGFDPSLKTIVLVQHPDTTDALPPSEQIGRTIAACRSFNGNVFILGANADAGGVEFNERLQAFTSSRTHCRFTITLSHGDCLSWLSASDALVGNSSSGIIEAASLRIPVVNIGDRQRGRLQSGNVVNVPFDSDAIAEAIRDVTTDERLRKQLMACTNVYGDGHASEQIVRILTEYLQKR